MDGQLSGLPFRWDGPESAGLDSAKSFWGSREVAVKDETEEQLGSQEWRDSGGMGGGRSGGGGGGGSLWKGGGAGRGLSCLRDIPGDD